MDLSELKMGEIAIFSLQPASSLRCLMVSTLVILSVLYSLKRKGNVLAQINIQQVLVMICKYLIIILKILNG